MNPDLEEMLVGLREAQSEATKLEAGQVLVQAGWCLFPIPDMQKFDTGLSHLNATVDPGVFTEMAESVMSRHECRDVNLAIVPGRCQVPLLGIDLDGKSAIDSFAAEAWTRGHADLGMWLRVNTTRKDEGRHVYFVAPEGRSFGNGSHRWGGEVRSGKGHLVFPPSTTALGRYTWAGEILKEAPEWLLEGLPASAGGSYRRVSRDELGPWLEALSRTGWTAYSEAALQALLGELRASRGVSGVPGRGRNPTLAKVVNRVMDLSLAGELPALDALDAIKETYFLLFLAEEKEARDLGGEFVRCVESWASNKEDLEDQLDALNARMAWTHSHAGGDPEEARRLREENVLEIADTFKRERPRLRSAALNWKASIGK